MQTGRGAIRPATGQGGRKLTVPNVCNFAYRRYPCAFTIVGTNIDP